MEVDAERVECIGALAKANFLFHYGQLGRFGLGTGVARESRRKEQRNVEDVVVGGEGGEAKFWLVYPLELAKLCELTANSRTQLNGAQRKIVRTLLCDKSAQVPPARCQLRRSEGNKERTGCVRGPNRRVETSYW